MPFGGHDMSHEPFEPVLVVNQLREQMPQIPIEQDAANVEDHAAADHAHSGHAKAPPEASDGVTLFTKRKRGKSAPRRSISPGAP